MENQPLYVWVEFKIITSKNGNGAWGMGHGESGMGNRAWGIGHGESDGWMGPRRPNRESVMTKQEMTNDQKPPFG